MDVKFNYKVCVKCITYNHAPYIENALQGFINQNTSFPFVVVVIDDASTDNAVSIIDDFIHSKFTPYKNEFIVEESEDAIVLHGVSIENNNCQLVFYALKYNHYSKKISKKEYFDKFPLIQYHISM